MLKGQDSFLDIGGISELLRCETCNCIHKWPMRDNTSPVVNVFDSVLRNPAATVIDGILVRSPVKSSQSVLMLDAVDKSLLHVALLALPQCSRAHPY